MPTKLEDRYLEIWNLVFMQDELSAVRSKEDFDIVGPLPEQEHRHRDGARAGRLPAAGRRQHVRDRRDVPGDRARPRSSPAARYGADHDDDVRMRVVADHVRSSLMLIADGVTPGNEGRGYVLRRLLRRAVRSMRLLGSEDRVLPELLPVSRDKMGETYAELHRDWDRISQVAYAEEDAFRQTLRAGTTIFDQAAADGTTCGRHRAQRRARLRAPRHLRLPDRPDPGDGRRAGARRRRGRLPRADGPAAPARQGRRPRQEGRPRRHRRRTARWRTPSAGRWSSPATARSSARAPCAASSRDGEVVDSARARATRSSWSSTARRSTPRAAASSPTRA